MSDLTLDEKTRYAAQVCRGVPLMTGVDPKGRAWRMIPMDGLKFNRLTVIRFSHHSRQMKRYYECVCDCGNSAVVIGSKLRTGLTKSCGCYQREISTKHGGKDSPEYAIWTGMLSRCSNPRLKAFKWYGARGITVCERWKDDFGSFIADMGPRPSPKHSIDRINNNGNYEPGNCRWATAKQQANNKRQANQHRSATHA